VPEVIVVGLVERVLTRMESAGALGEECLQVVAHFLGT